VCVDTRRCLSLTLVTPPPRAAASSIVACVLVEEEEEEEEVSEEMFRGGRNTTARPVYVMPLRGSACNLDTKPGLPVGWRVMFPPHPPPPLPPPPPPHHPLLPPPPALVCYLQRLKDNTALGHQAVTTVSLLAPLKHPLSIKLVGMTLSGGFCGRGCSEREAAHLAPNVNKSIRVLVLFLLLLLCSLGNRCASCRNLLLCFPGKTVNHRQSAVRNVQRQKRHGHILLT